MPSATRSARASLLRGQHPLGQHDAPGAIWRAYRRSVLGEGWVAEEALAIATHCALTADGFRSGVLHAVKHSGDSDSTGSICGSLLETSLGTDAIDPGLLGELEGRDVITQIADDLHDVFARGQLPPAQRYPAG